MRERMLVLAPRGRDAQVIEQVLRREALASQVCLDLACMRRCLEEDVGGIVVTEEALAGPDIESLLAWCENQPPWSDMPVVVMATRQAGHRSAAAALLLERLGNVVLLERPVNAETLASAARSSLRARRRQYQARTLLFERERNERALRELNETLERRVEERARELDVAHQTLSVALDSAGMGSWEFDLLTGDTRRSLQHDRIFGYPDGCAAWNRDIFLAHVIDEERASIAERFDRATVAGGTLELECCIRRPDGALRWIVVKGRVGYNAVGRSMRLAGVVMDVTDRRQTEDTLHRAQKMEAIGQLTGGVAHDFNNLLTVIIGGLDMVLRKPEDTARVVRLAGAALLAARRGEELTAQLLAFSRRQMLRPVTIDPARLLTDFAELARRALGEAVTLQLDLDPGTVPIRVDPAQFESAVLNLAVNARDAMPEGGSVTIACRNLLYDAAAPRGQDMPPGPTVMVSVADTGTGIDAQTLARAFEPFFTTKDVGKGSGLGLSQVYGFARSAGGTVAIESELGRGTTVRLYFPQSADLPAQEPRFAPPKTELRSAEGGETVLLVEDDEQVRSMAVESLEELRYTVLVARDAKQALDHVNGSGRIDVMFSDVVMPGGMDGAQLAIEARKRRPSLKILLTSGYVGEPASEKMISAGVDVLTKPYRRDELARKLRGVLSRA